MAQEIMVAGAIYEGVPSVRLPDSNGVFHPFTDTSDTTAVAADVAQGKTFHLADGSAATGTAAGATLVTKSITANGTYSAEDDDADGYSEVTVNVSGGGGGGGVDPKDVNFIDYDGTVLHAYTAAEFAALTALPENPTHDGLVAQGWNLSLSDAKSRVASCGFLTVGQTYATASGDTEIDIELHEGRLSPYLGLAVNGTVTIDWGDGSATNTVTGTSVTTQKQTLHNYAAVGSYTIKVHVDSGTLSLFGTFASSLLSAGKATANENLVYATCVMAVRIASGVTIGSYAFLSFRNMSYVTIPSGVTSIGESAFNGCYRMGFVALPSTVTTIGASAFQYVGQKAMTIPSGVSAISSKCLHTCSQMTALVVPSGVSSIAANSLANCYGLAELHFLRSTPPSVSDANAFTNLPTDCTIYVPTGSLSAYTSANRYPSSSTYTYVEE